MDFKLGVLLVIAAQICATSALPQCDCKTDSAPVCGSDGVTYDSQCLLECTAATSKTDITQVKLGSCEESANRSTTVTPLAKDPYINCSCHLYTHMKECIPDYLDSPNNCELVYCRCDAPGRCSAIACYDLTKL